MVKLLYYEHIINIVVKNRDEILKRIEEEEKLIESFEEEGYRKMSENPEDHQSEPFIQSRMAKDRLLTLKWVLGEIDIWLD